MGGLAQRDPRGEFRMSCILGIDPGKSGALAFYWPDEPELVAVEDMPLAGGCVDAVELAKRIAIMQPSAAFVESVGARPGQGVVSMFTFGQSFGTALGVLAALKVPTHLIRPQAWKKYFGLSSDKEQSRALAIRLWPVSESFRRRRDEGRAEAALLARYGAMHLAAEWVSA